MTHLKLSNSKLLALVDDEDYPTVSKYTWSVTGKSIQGYVNYHNILLGRFLLGYQGPETIDHKDRNFLNNQKFNLRIATYAQNTWNKSKKLNASSQYKGVNWNKQCNKWVARIMFKGKSIYLGCFISEESAAKAYNRAALKYFGEFAAINTIRAGNEFCRSIHGAHSSI
jgi:hypothetical protein